jgi:thiol-disulfide isomerase/thioredoxin
VADVSIRTRIRTWKTSSISLGLIALVLGSAAATTDEYRTWKDATGKYQVDAVLVSQTDTDVKLRNRDGKELTVLKEKLSVDDLAYLDKQASESMLQDADQASLPDTMSDTDADAAASETDPGAKRVEANPDQVLIKKLAEKFFADLRTEERAEAKSLLTNKARSLLEEDRSALPYLPSPDKGSRAIRIGKPSVRKEDASVIVTVQVGKRQQTTMLAFRRDEDHWRVNSISASRGDVEVTVDFESPYQPGDPKKDTPATNIGGTVEITGVTLDGRRVALSDYKGKVVLVDFWATWCGPCVKELPNVYENYLKYHSMGFEVLAISLDRDMSDLQRFLVEKNPPWTVLADAHPSNPQSMASKYGIRAIPTMLLIGKDGRVLDANCRGPSLGAKLAEIFGG